MEDKAVRGHSLICMLPLNTSDLLDRRKLFNDEKKFYSKVTEDHLAII